MESATDRAEFFNLDDFAVVATYQGNSINGIFGDQFVEINGVESSRPTFLTTATAVPDDPHDNTIVIDSVNYTIVGHQPDGTGFITLILETV